MKRSSRNWLAVLTVGCLSIPAAFALEPSGDSWPQWRGPARDGRSREKGVNTDWTAKQPALLWKLSGFGGGYASVSVQGDRLYTTGNVDGSQCLIAVDLGAKEIAWKTKLTSEVPKHGYDGSRCTPSIDGDRVFVITSNGQISCVSTTGDFVWKREFREWGGKMMSGWGFSESPLVDGDTVLCTPGGANGMVVCLNKKDGKEVWAAKVDDFGSAGKPGAGYASIVASNAGGVKQYVTLVGRGVIGVRATDGKLLWSYNRVANGTANIPTCIVKDDYVFTSSGYNDGGTALLKLAKAGDEFKVEEIYYKNNKELQNHHGGMILHGDFVYMGHGHNKGFPTCIDMLTGDVKWGREIRGPGGDSACITLVDDHIVFRYQSGEVGLIEATPEKYNLKGSFRPEIVEREGWAHPVVCQKKLFLREQNHLMVYDLAK